MQYDVLIAGAGVTGGMIARELSKYNLSMCILEKGNDVAAGASKANSGIVHGGYDPEPGTLKAKLNSRGVALLYRAAEMLHVPYRQNGSMICAFGAEEEPRIRELYDRGVQNGIAGMEIMRGDAARQLEPGLSPEISLVLRVPTAGIICPYKLTVAAVGNAMDNGAELKRNFEITGIEREGGIFTVVSQSGERAAGKYLINCAGCYSDRIAQMAGDCDFAIIPRAGEYLLLDKAEGGRVSHTIFQVPTAEGKGILVTPTVDGNLLTGPTAAVVESPERDAVTPGGIKAVTSLAKKSVPGVDFSSVITSFTGIRASVESGDFIIGASEKVDGLINVAAIDSPGLTCCAAIAEYVAAILRDMDARLEEKAGWDGCRADTGAFNRMGDEDKDAFIRENPDYGRIVCRCEMITEGEIRDALRRNPPALDMDGVKRRTRAGMGRCQSGFCAPHVMRLIAEESGTALEEITKNGGNSRMLVGRI